MKEAWLGILFVGALALLLVLAFTLGGAGSLGEAFGPAQKDIKIRFPAVTGLKVKNDILVSGVRVGAVTDFETQRDGTVIVTGRVDQSAPIYQNGKAEIIDASFIGGKLIDISPGDSRTGDLGDLTLSGDFIPNVFTAAGRMMDRIAIAVDDLVLVMKDVQEVVRDVKDGRGPVGVLLRDEEAARNIQEIISEVRDASRSINSASREIVVLLNEVNHGKGTMHRIIYDEQMSRSVSEAMASIREGTSEFSLLMTDARRIAAAAEGGDGLIASLLNDEKLKADFAEAMDGASETMLSAKAAFAEAEIALRNVNQGKGTLGKLATDDSLYNDLLRAVNTLQQGFEDIREQAPVTAFASVVFQVFQ